MATEVVIAKAKMKTMRWTNGLGQKEAAMKNPPRKLVVATPSRQCGVVLLIALIALVAMSLAAVALIRSVDTATTIAGNLAFKQAATSAGDSGFETGVAWLKATSEAEIAAGRNPVEDASHALNNDSVGYYSSISAPTDVTAESVWSATTSFPATGLHFSADGEDSETGNTVRYIIQRMCRIPNQVISPANCSGNTWVEENSPDGKSTRVVDSNEAGSGIWTPAVGGGAGSWSTAKSPVYRITARVVGPKNTISYIQGYTY